MVRSGFSRMDSSLIVLGFGYDPRIFKGINGEAREPNAEGLPVITYKARSLDDCFNPVTALVDLLDLLELLDLFSLHW